MSGKRVRTAVLAAAIGAFAGLTASVAQAPAATVQTVAIPATQAGNRAREVLASLLADHAAREALVRKTFTAKALAGTPVSDWVALLDTLAEQSGGLDPVAISPDSDENFLVMDMRARKVDRYARIYFAVARKTDPGKIADLGVFAIRDPRRTAEDAWPTQKLSISAIARAIDVRAKRLAMEDLLSGTILVAHNGKPVYTASFGEAEKVFHARNTPDTRFNIASAGKMFTAIAIGELVDAGKLSLEDTLAKWLPDFPNQEWAAKIRIRHLLSHTSGLGDFFGPDYARERTGFVRASDYFPLIAKDPLAFEPGTGFRYSNGGFALLGAIIERASGETYDDYLAKHVFAPAGMTGAGNFALDAVVPNRATGYASGLLDPLGIEPRKSNIMTIAYVGNGAGGQFASARDLLAFSRTLQGNKLMSPQTTALFTAAKVDFVGSPRAEKYRYGFAVSQCGAKAVIGHGGGGANSGVDSTLLMFADASWTIIVLTNQDPPTGDDFAHGLCEFLARQ